MSLDQLKTYFQTGDRPTQSQFEELIESIGIESSKAYAFIRNPELNFMNPLSVDGTKQIGTTNGQIQNNTNGIGISGQMLVFPLMKFKVENRHPLRLNVHAYDESDNWLGLLAEVDGVFTCPQNTSYINANIWQNDESQYANLVKFLYVSSSEDNFKEVLFNDVTAVNLFNSENVVFNSFVHTSGSFNSSPGWLRSGPINITGGETYYAHGFNQNRFDVHQYQSDNSWISKISIVLNEEGLLEIPTSSNASYLVVNIAQDVEGQSAKDTLIIFDGTGEYIQTIKPELLPNTAISSSTVNVLSRRFFSRRRPTISFQFDDTTDTDDLVYQIFQERGLLPSFAIRTDRLTPARQSRYKSFFDAGCTILAHSVNHPPMNDTSISASDVEFQMKESKLALENLGIDVSGWVTPNSILHESFTDLAIKYFGYAVTKHLSTSPDYTFDETNDPIRLSRFSMEQDGQTLNDLKTRVDTAITNNELLIFYGHSLPSTYTDTSTGTSSLTQADLEGLLDYLVDKVEDGECLVLPSDQAVSHYYKPPVV